MVCGTINCEGHAISLVTWPGKRPVRACVRCKARALVIASLLGFHVHTEPLTDAK